MNTFAKRLEAIKQYENGLITFLELLFIMQMDADQMDAALLLKAAHSDMSASPAQMASIMDNMVEGERDHNKKFPRVSN